MPSPPPPGSRPPGASSARPLTRVPIAPGVAGVEALVPALRAALDGSGPAIAPVPAVSTSVSNSYVMSVLEATRPDDASLPLESDEVAVVMATSGSTGNPRGVLITAAQLTSMTEFVNAPGPFVTTSPQWIVALPVTSMGGLNVLVRAIGSGRSPIALPSLGGAEPFTPASFAQAVSVAVARSGDVRVALVPAQVARLLSDESGIEALRACSVILVGGGAMRSSLREIAAQLGITVTTTYGATETCGGCVFDGVPLPGVTVRVTGTKAGTEQGTGPSGRAMPGILAIEGPCVAMGYRGLPGRSAACFDGTRFTTSDLGTVIDGRVEVIGRADDVVVVKGVNVSPGAVERVLADLPDIVAAAAVGTPDRDGEPRIWAFVEVRDGASDVESTCAAAVVERLGLPARPAAVRRVDRLPHLANGKVDRELLMTWARGIEPLDGGPA